MRSEKYQHAEAAMKTKMNDRIKRRRSSSRCSRKDIWPPSSSSRPRFVESDLKSADMGSGKNYSQSCFLTGCASACAASAGISIGSGGFSTSASEKVCGWFSRATTRSEVPVTGSALGAGSYTGVGCDSSSELSSARVVSKATSRSHVRLKSSEAFRNSARPFPIDLAS